MKISRIYNNYKLLINDNLSFIYNGNFTDDVTEQLINLSESNLNNFQAISKIKRKATFLMLECFQNVIRHGEKLNDETLVESHDGFYVTRNLGNKYYISSANSISNSAIPDLTNRLLNINDSSSEELKKQYITSLTNNTLSNKGGAGLGLIEMARRSGKPLEFDFKTIDENKSYFYLQITLERNSDINCETNIEPLNIKKSHEFHVNMKSENIFIVHKGYFTPQSVGDVLAMIERNIANQMGANIQKKRVYRALVELLQNVSLHAKPTNSKREGIFQMGKTNGKYDIGIGNLIENKNVEIIHDSFTEINKLSKEELHQQKIENLKTKSIRGLGLLKLRSIAEQIDYEIIPVNSSTSFFSILVTI